MNIIIRCDSSFTIGTGHVFRCLTLAMALRKSGWNVLFICRKLEGNIISFIEEKQFKVIELDGAHNPLKDAVECSQIITQFSPSWVIVDHYELGETWEKKVSETGVKIFVIDDLYQVHFCHALLNQNGHKNDYRKGTAESYFLGPEYALLADSYRSLVPRNRKFQEKSIMKILVFFGGADLKNETLRLINLARDFGSAVSFIYVVGKSNPHLEKIKLALSSLPNGELHVNTNRMHELLNDADLFLGAGGTVTWERCYLGLPAVCVAVAENQEAIAQELHDRGVHLYLGRSEDITDADYVKAVGKVLSDKELWESYQRNSLELKVSSKFQDLINLFKS